LTDDRQRRHGRGPARRRAHGRGGSPRAVAPRYAGTTALGWTTDGRAIVFSPKATCGGSWKSGTYLVSPDGEERTLVARSNSFDAPLERSLEPRSVDEVIAAAGP
jgi:hypothetical protein